MLSYEAALSDTKARQTLQENYRLTSLMNTNTKILNNNKPNEVAY